MKRGGIYYALPRTKVVIDVTVERKQLSAGLYNAYATTCLQIPDALVLKKDAVSYSLQPSSIAAINEPDPAHVFLLDIRGRYFENKLINASYASTGTLNALVAESDDGSVQVALEALKAAAGLAAKTAAFGRLVEVPEKSGETKPEVVACNQYKNLLEARAGVIAAIQGAVPKETLLAVLKEHDDAIRAVRQYYFTGSEVKTTVTRRFQHLPYNGDPVVLLKFTEEDGICWVNNELLAGPGFPPTVMSKSDGTKTDKPKGCQQPLSVSIKYSVPSISLAKILKEPAETGERGLYYRIPVDVPVNLVGENNVYYASATLELAQLGTVRSLPNSTGGRKTAYTADFTPGGALKNFKVNSTAMLDKTLVESLAGTASNALEAAAKASDPVAPVKRRTELLEAERKLIEAQKALDEARATVPTAPTADAVNEQQ
jgi:hypothetical protein